MVYCTSCISDNGVFLADFVMGSPGVWKLLRCQESNFKTIKPPHNQSRQALRKYPCPKAALKFYYKTKSFLEMGCFGMWQMCVNTSDESESSHIPIKFFEKGLLCEILDTFFGKVGWVLRHRDLWRCLIYSVLVLICSSLIRFTFNIEN